MEAATFDNVTNNKAFPAGSAARAWVDLYGDAKAAELAAAKLADPSLTVIYETDMIVLPKGVIDLYHDEIVDATTGRVSIDRPKTLELLGAMFDEIITRFPAVDGFQIRVGEVYTLDFPFHAGDGAVDYSLPVAAQIAQYAKLINWLRDLVCVKHRKILVFRTWDTAGFVPASPPRFHGNLSYYLNVTNQIEPHPQLYFSIKHTMLDYWRYMRFNPCLNHGVHAQIIEVECEREYEGKGSHPNYIGAMVIGSFPEVVPVPGLPSGLAALKAAGGLDPTRGGLIRGLRVWARGGGWQGPYIHGFESNVMLNVWVVSQWFRRNGTATEAELFDEYCTTRTGLAPTSCALYREIQLASADAVLHTHYCEAWDSHLNNSYMPTNNWMRDDNLGGLAQLGSNSGFNAIFRWLSDRKLLLTEALAEKRDGAERFAAIEVQARALLEMQQASNPRGVVFARQLMASARSGAVLAEIISFGWAAMAYGYVGDRAGGCFNTTAIQSAIAGYDAAWAKASALRVACVYAASAYHDFYRANSQYPDGSPGIGASVNRYRNVTDAVNRC